MVGPSKNLSWSELSCKDGTPYPDEYRLDGTVVNLSFVFEQIRTVCGNRIIKIHSAYRSKKHNTSIRGAKNSQHVLGKALDLAPPKGYTVKKFYDLIKTLAQTNVNEIGGIGLYPTFVHIDIRKRVNGKITYWKGSGVKDAL